jgi:hypothetical protein
MGGRVVIRKNIAVLTKKTGELIGVILRVYIT